MTELEDRLRRELRELRPRPELIRPLRVPPPRQFARTKRWLIPAASAAAVAVIAAVVAVVAGLVGGASAPTGPTAPMTVQVARTLPRYYVVAFQRYINNGRTIATYAAVHDTATGAVLASKRVPTLFMQGGAYAPSITGAADDRTFVLMESGQTSVHDVVWCFLLRVSASGRSVKLTKLPVSVPSSMAIDDAALSPDGTRLAMTVQWSCGTGAVTKPGSGSWTLQLAASRAGRRKSTAHRSTCRGLAMTRWRSSGRRASRTRHRPAHGLPADRCHRRGRQPAGQPGCRLAVRRADRLYARGPGDARWQGRHHLRRSRTSTPGPGVSDVVARVLELSASTGRTVRVLYTTTVDHVSQGGNGKAGSLDQECNVLSLGPAVGDPLVECFSIGVLMHGKLVTLPGFPSPSSSGISGQDAIAW